MIGKIKKHKLLLYIILILISLLATFISISCIQNKTKTLFRYEIINNGIKITEYFGNEESVVIPDKIDGKPVTVIGDNAFYQHTQITSVVLPESLTVIEGAAFYRCYSLTDVIIPKNVSNIGANPFFRCSSLKKILVDPNNQYFMAKDGVLFNKNQTTIIAYPENKESENYTIPTSVKKIEKDAFGYHCKHLKYLVIASNVTEFPNYNMFVYPDDITLIVEEGSAAHHYAVENKLNYEIVQSVG